MNLSNKPAIMSDFKSTVNNYIVYDYYYDSMVRPFMSRNISMGLKGYIKYGYHKRMPIRFYIEHTCSMSDLINTKIYTLYLIKKYPTYVSRGGRR